MDYKAFVDRCATPCAVISTEVTADSKRGDISIVCGNQAFCRFAGRKVCNGMPIGEVFSDEASVRDLCVRSAIMGKRAHSYRHNHATGTWMDLTFVPLLREREDTGLCLLFAEAADTPNPERMAAVSVDTAAAAVKASVTLLAAEDLRQSVQQVLADIVERTKAFSAVLTLVDHERRETSNYGEAFVKGAFTGTKLKAVVTPYETCENWQRILDGSGKLVVVEPQDLDVVSRHDPEWARTLRSYGVESLILCSLRQGSETFGYLLLSNFDVERFLEVIELMELVSFLLSAEISNHLLMAQLEHMSTHDELTHLLNRHAMDRDFEAIVTHSPFGIVSVDLNGLKHANDHFGHGEGDRLLLRASKVMSGVFSGQGLYRVGGDEFMVMATGISREEFEDAVERLRLEAAAADVSMAVGACWSDGTSDIDEILSRVDELMYADKATYYAKQTDGRDR